MQVIKRQVFDSFDDISLIWACIEQAIQPIRGQNFAIKAEAYSQLNPSQQALFMFQVFYGHTIHGVMGFYNHLEYLLSNRDVWSELKNGMHFFRDDTIFHLLGEMEGVYNALKSGTTLNDPEFNVSIKKLDKILHEQLPATIALIGAYIRSHPGEFVQIED